MAEGALAAAIWPYENGSSTIGVKKSTVCTSARWRSNRYTPASSNVFELTSTFLFKEMGSCGKTCRRACWLNFDAHPAQDESDVSFRICSRDIWFTSSPIADCDCGLRIALERHWLRIAPSARGFDRGDGYGEQFIRLGKKIVQFGVLQELPRKNHFHPICRFVALFFHHAKLGDELCL